MKHSIFISRTNNPKVVKAVSLFVGGAYLAGLFAVWHVPPLFIEISLRNMLGIASGIFAWMNPDHLLLPTMFRVGLQKITEDS